MVDRLPDMEGFKALYQSKPVIIMNAGGAPQFALDHIRTEYNDEVILEYDDQRAFGRIKSLAQNVRSTLAGFVDVGLSNEVYQTANTIDTVSSSNAGDAQTLHIVGHTIDGSGDFTLVEQQVTLNGQNKVTLATPLARLELMYNIGGANLVGTIYGYRDTAIVAGVPTDKTTVHCTIPVGLNQSEKAALTVPKNKYYIITGFYVCATRATPAGASTDIELEIRRKDGVFRSEGGLITLRTDAQSYADFKYTPYLIAHPNSDIRLVGETNTNATGLACGIEAYIGVIPNG